MWCLSITRSATNPGAKVRPALVVLSDFYNQKLDHTVVALITSSRSRFVGDPSQLVIEPASLEGGQSGLRLTSVVQCENLLSIKQTRILRRLGHLLSETMSLIDACLKSAFGLL